MERLDGGGGGGAALARLGPDRQMFAVGLVPDRDDVGPLARGAEAGLQLGLGLPGEAVTHAKRVFSNRQKFIHYKREPSSSQGA